MVRQIESELTPKEYMRHLKSKFHTPFAVFSERVTGIAIGPFFSVAYYSPYEWNRRITNECSRAFGWVKNVDGKAQVRFIYSSGQFSPFWILFYFALFFLVCTGMFVDFFGVTACLIGSLLLSVLCCGITAVTDSLTEAGAAGHDTLTYLLYEPNQFYC